jgi:glycosyltransferase involved in cell wall biosynthesis
METLRFLLVTTFYPPHSIGGDAIHVKHLADLLAGDGHDVTVVYSGDAARWKHVFRDEERVEGDEKIVMISSRFPMLGVGIPYLTNLGRTVMNRLAQICLEVEPDIVHHHNIAALGWHQIRGQWRTIYTAHDYWAICQRSDLLKYGEKFCRAPNCLRCCALTGRPPQLWRKWNGTVGPQFNPCTILAPSRFMMRQLQRRLDDFQGRFVHCPNFVPDSGFSQSEKTDRLLYVGVLSPQKGVRELVSAVVSTSSLRLEVVGEGPDRKYLESVVRNGQAEDRVSIRGWVPRDVLVGLYRSARALVIPSMWPENAPLVALEAFAAGTPVLASRRGGLPELLDHIDSRLCKEPAELLAEINSLDWVDRLQGNFRQEWERFYSPPAFRQRYFEILEGDFAF